MRIKILVLDDEESICEILKYNLEKEGYDVDCAYCAEDALQHDLSVYSLCIVDIMMENLSGFDFVKRLRYNPATENIPVIFCSALQEPDDKVMGLNIGADDYITKPFDLSEFIARVRAVLRRSNAYRQVAYNANRSDYEPDITFKTLKVNRNEKVCTLDGEKIRLTRTEMDILLFFLTHRNKIYSRKEIIGNVWSHDVVVTPRTIDTNITRLRRKLGEYGAYIVTAPGYGYGFNEA
ncbi:MAG: response regulator transcription factor [Muribaculaceae bacterium]